MTIPRCLAFGVLVVCAASLLARPGTIRTRDGRSIEGDITEKPDGSVVVATRAGTVTLSAGEVGTISYAGNIREEYQKRLAALPANAGAREHLVLARWLYDNREYELARTELDTALALDPNNAEAVTLRQTVDRNIQWQKRTPGVTARPATRPGAIPAAQAPIGRDRRLTPEQINQIRHAELKKTDAAVRFRLENNVVRRFTEYANIDTREFARLSDFEKVLLIYEKGTSEMRSDIRILSDPSSLLEFKQRIQPMIVSGCAAANCHSAPSAPGNFSLLAPPDNESATYTNFYLLNRKRVEFPDKFVGKMIDRAYPHRSLVLQFGLPRERAEWDHPDVQGWNHAFRGEDDPRYVQALMWIKESLVLTEPEYKFEVDQTAATQAVKPVPSAAPAAPAAPARNDRTTNNSNNGRQGNESTEDALKNARDRLRPIRGGVPGAGGF